MMVPDESEIFPNPSLRLPHTEHLFDRNITFVDFSSPMCGYNRCVSPGGFLNFENSGHMMELKDTAMKINGALGYMTEKLETANTEQTFAASNSAESSLKEEKTTLGVVSGTKKMSTRNANPRKRLYSERNSESKAKPRRKLGKARLEKNRISAREFRLKRKAYIGTLEDQVSTLQKQLLDYQKELNSYKLKEQEEILRQLNKQEESTEDLSCPITGRMDINDHTLNSYIVYYPIILLGFSHLK